MAQSQTFSDQFREQFRELLLWRRDVRRFRTEPLPPGLLRKLLDLATLAPSVGLSVWRFVLVERAETRTIPGWGAKFREKMTKLKAAKATSS